MSKHMSFQSQCVASERSFQPSSVPTATDSKNQTRNQTRNPKQQHNNTKRTAIQSTSRTAKPGNLRSLESKAKGEEKNRARQTSNLRSLDRKEKPQHNDRQESRCLNIFPKLRPGFHSTRTAQFTMGLHPCRPPKPWMSTTPSMRTAPHSHGHILQPFSSYMLDTLNQSHLQSLDLNMTPRSTCQA